MRCRRRFATNSSSFPSTKMDEVLLEALETPEKIDLKPRGPKGGKKSPKDQVADTVP